MQLLLVWNPQKGSPIHDHANAHCIMKVLAGSLRETVYYTPEQDYERLEPLRIKSDKEHFPNDVAYIADDIGLHRVHNPSPDKVAVSLHCTFGPNSSSEGRYTGILTFYKYILRQMQRIMDIISLTKRRGSLAMCDRSRQF